MMRTQTLWFLGIGLAGLCLGAGMGQFTLFLQHGHWLHLFWWIMHSVLAGIVIYRLWGMLLWMGKNGTD